MEVTLESVQKNKEIYNKNINKIKKQRAELIKKVIELRKQKETLTDEIFIAQLDFEEAKLVQQINDLTSVFKTNKLTLEQLELQEDVLKSKIDRETYSKGMVTNRKAKANLSNEQELDYCENEVIKCRKALKLYIMIGDKESISKWQKAFEEAKRSLELAKQEIDKEQEIATKKDNEKQKQTPYINQYEEINRVDNDEKITEKEEYLTGYTFEERDGIFTEKWNQVLKDDSGKEIGNMTITEVEKIGEKRIVKKVGKIENDNGKYSIKEEAEGMGEEYFVQKEIKGYNKLTGNNEQFHYSKDKMGNEFAYSKINEKIKLRVSRTNSGTTIEIYDDNGNIQDTFEYDKEDKAINGVQGMDKIQQDYVEKFFERVTRNATEYYAEGINILTQDKESQNEDIVKSAVEATEKTTRTSTINTQAQTMKTVQRDKQSTRQPKQETERDS